MSTETKTKILLKATELFSNRGFDSVGINEIVQQCGITKPTLYHYFGSKENLLKIIVSTNIQILIDKLSRCSSENRSFTQRLTIAADMYLQFSRDNKPFFRLYLSLVFTPHSNKAYEIVKTAAETVHLNIESIFKSETAFSSQSSFFTASFIGQVNMFSTLILNDYIQYSDKLSEKLIQMYLNGAGSVTV